MVTDSFLHIFSTTPWASTVSSACLPTTVPMVWSATIPMHADVSPLATHSAVKTRLLSTLKDALAMCVHIFGLL